jgi:hypothetical protein
MRIEISDAGFEPRMGGWLWLAHSTCTAAKTDDRPGSGDLGQYSL